MTPLQFATEWLRRHGHVEVTEDTFVANDVGSMLSQALADEYHCVVLWRRGMTVLQLINQITAEEVMR